MFSILIITKGHSSVNIARGVTVLVLCTSSNHGLHLYQVCCKYLGQFKSYGADTISILIITKGIIPQILHVELQFLFLFTSSDHGLLLYQVW